MVMGRLAKKCNPASSLLVGSFGPLVSALIACSVTSPTTAPLDAGLFSIDSATFDAGQDILTQVTCSQSLSDAGMYTDLCTCTAESVNFGQGGGSSTTYSGETCPRDSNELCCADKAYPSSGTCSCQYSGQTYVWGCIAASPVGDCQCGYGVSGAAPGSKCDTTLAAFSNCYLTTDVVPEDTLCECGPDAAAGDMQVTSCTTEAAAGLTPYRAACPSGQVETAACGTPTPPAGSGTGSGTGSPTTNVCPEGPGTCANGDSSTCRCSEACVETANGTGTYECVKGCASDADCAGYFSGDTPPAPLVCIPASSTMPTPHCGI
jgi:hypothetical protein